MKKNLFVFLAASLFLNGCNNSEEAKQDAEKEKKEPQKAVFIYEVETYDYTPSLTLWGDVSTPTGEPLYLISETSGTLMDIPENIFISAKVNEGDLLLSIDDQEQNLRLQQADATVKMTASRLQELEVNLEAAFELLELENEAFMAAESSYQRYQDLAEQKLASNSTLEAQRKTYIAARQQILSRKTNLQSLEAQVETQKATLENNQAQKEQAELDLQKTKITAPQNGEVLDIHVQKGQYIQPNQQIITLLNKEEVGVRVMSPPQQLQELLLPQNGYEPVDIQDIQAYFSVNDQIWPLKLSQRPAQISKESRQVELYFLFDTTDKNTPLLNSHGEVSILSPYVKQSMMIPRDSILDGHVYILQDDGTMEKRKIHALSFGLYAWVIDGLEEGEKLVLQPPVPYIEEARFQGRMQNRMKEQIETFIADQQGRK